MTFYIGIVSIRDIDPVSRELINNRETVIARPSDLRSAMCRNTLTVKIWSRYYGADIKIFLPAVHRAKCIRAILPESVEKIERFIGGSSAVRLPVVGIGILETNRYHFTSGGYDFSTIPTGRHRRNDGA